MLPFGRLTTVHVRRITQLRDGQGGSVNFPITKTSCCSYVAVNDRSVDPFLAECTISHKSVKVSNRALAGNAILLWRPRSPGEAPVRPGVEMIRSFGRRPTPQTGNL